MRGLAHYDGAPVAQLRLATRVALANLVDLALAEEADALLIVGDLFEPGLGRSRHRGLLCARDGRLREAGVRDDLAEVAAGLKRLENAQMR